MKNIFLKKIFTKSILCFVILILLFTMIFHNTSTANTSTAECHKTDSTRKKIVTGIQETSLNYLFNNFKNYDHCINCCEACNHLICKYSYRYFIHHEFNLKLLKLNLPNLLFADSIYRPPR